ncbi:hypothetical protein GGF31_001959 [Allomyces arbusculus]|nr:hypothetical protein GGF31_001959 [Allomyces arbusculus]
MHAAAYAGGTVHPAPVPFAPSAVQSAAAPIQPPPPVPAAPAAPAPASNEPVPAIPDTLRGVVPQGVDESSFWLGMQAANSTFTTMLLSQLSPAAQSQLLAALLQNVNPFTAASAVAAAVAASGSTAGAQVTTQPQPPQQMVAQQVPAPAPVPPNVQPQSPMPHPAAGTVFVSSTSAAGTPDGGHGGPFSQHPAHANLHVRAHPHQSAPGLAHEYPTAPPHYDFHALHGKNDSVLIDAHHPAATGPPPPVSGPGWPLTDPGSRDPFQQLVSLPHAPTTTAPPPISLSSPHHTFAPELRLSPASLAVLEPFSSDTVGTASHAALLHLRTPPGPMDTGPPGAECSAPETAASTPHPPPSLLGTDATMADADPPSTSDLAALLADPFGFCDPLAGGAIQPVSFLPPPPATALESAISHVGGPAPFHLPPCLGDAPLPQDALCPLADGTAAAGRGDTPLALMAMLDIEDFLVDAALAGGGGEGDSVGAGLGVPEPAVAIGFDPADGGGNSSAAAPRRRRARTKSVVAGGGPEKMDVDGAKPVKAARKRRKTDLAAADAGQAQPAPPSLPLLAPMPPLASRSVSTTDAGSSAADDEEDDAMPEYKCAHCGTTKTPLWRRGENEEVLCNACGLYVKNNKRPRPLTLCQSATVRAPAEPAPPPECANCGTNTTSLWRRSKDGDPWCNACALYYKLHGKTRPATMRATVVKKRNRYPKKSRAKSGSAEPSAGKTPTPTPTPAPEMDVAATPDPTVSATAMDGLTLFAPG